MIPLPAALLIAAFLAPCAPGQSTPGRAWVPVRDEQAKCQVAFPQEPRHERQWLSTSQGRMLLHRMLASVDSGRAVYLLGWHDPYKSALRGMEPPQVLARMRDGMLARLPEGKLVEEKTCRSAPRGGVSYRGLECRFAGAQGMHVRVQFYLVQERLYQLHLIGTPEFVDDPRHSTPFFASFLPLP